MSLSFFQVFPLILLLPSQHKFVSVCLFLSSTSFLLSFYPHLPFSFPSSICLPLCLCLSFYFPSFSPSLFLSHHQSVTVGRVGMARLESITFGGHSQFLLLVKIAFSSPFWIPFWRRKRKAAKIGETIEACDPKPSTPYHFLNPYPIPPPSTSYSYTYF